MKVVIFAGGLGTRIAEETDVRPKPMVEIGGKPILWHIMKIYSQYGFNDFVICLGYKGYVIKEYFTNYFLHNSDITLDLADNKMEIHGTRSESFKVTLWKRVPAPKQPAAYSRSKNMSVPVISCSLTVMG